ncbi:hypothetical protein ABW19_dt0206208 [Dactylella cylindrospora]|nr:hypothetical protein ABW19_dt0206208 [Dactylella cylindrospora]
MFAPLRNIQVFPIRPHAPSLGREARDDHASGIIKKVSRGIMMSKISVNVGPHTFFYFFLFFSCCTSLSTHVHCSASSRRETPTGMDGRGKGKDFLLVTEKFIYLPLLCFQEFVLRLFEQKGSIRIQSDRTYVNVTSSISLAACVVCCLLLVLFVCVCRDMG